MRRTTRIISAAGKTEAVARDKRVSLVIPLFIVSLLVPIIFFVGPIRLSPYRLVILCLFIPCLTAWLSGRLGKIRLPDVLILLSTLWAAVALTVNEGLETAIEPAGIRLMETFGTYLLARRYVRDAESFATVVKTLFIAILVLLPFAAIESLSGQPVILEALRKVVPTFADTQMEPRYGLERAQVVFEHPILYGIFCASAFGLAWYVLGYRNAFPGRLFRAAVIGLSSIFSVSTGAIVTVVVQCFLMAWNHQTRKIAGRWKVLGLLFIGAYAAIDLLSNRSPFHVFVTYLTFSAGSAYNRILIWNYGTAEVARHPVFGIGLGDWERPSWMSGSMDNFWLVMAVFYGLPAFLLFAGGVLHIMRALGRAKLEDETISACRQGLLISLGGLVVAGFTVHYWNAIYCWFLFLVGSGVWMLEHGPAQTSTKASRGMRMEQDRA
jgi:hypothetical protein